MERRELHRQGGSGSGNKSFRFFSLFYNIGYILKPQVREASIKTAKFGFVKLHYSPSFFSVIED